MRAGRDAQGFVVCGGAPVVLDGMDSAIACIRPSSASIHGLLERLKWERGSQRTDWAMRPEAQPVGKARIVEAAVVARHGDGARRDGRQANDARVESGAAAVGRGIVACGRAAGWQGFHCGMFGIGCWSRLVLRL